jgi:hypothetical protein
MVEVVPAVLIIIDPAAVALEARVEGFDRDRDRLL